MGPFEAAEAIRMLGVKKVVPTHYGTFPALHGTPDQLRREAARRVRGWRCSTWLPGGTVE